MANQQSVRCSIDIAVAFANELFIEGWCDLGQQPDHVRIAVGERTVLHRLENVARTPRPDVAKALGTVSEEKLDYGVITHVPLAGLNATLTCPMEISFLCSGESWTTFRLKPKTIGRLALDHNPDARSTLDRALQAGMLDPGIAAILEASDLGFEGIPALGNHTDGIARVGKLIAVDMWISNGRMRNLYGITGDGVCAVRTSDMLFGARPDVSKHLQGIGETTLTNDHGTIILFPFASEGVDTVYVAAFEGGELSGLASASAKDTANKDRLIGRILRLAGAGTFPTAEFARRYLLPMVHEDTVPLEWTEIVVAEIDATPELSIIVPFYKEDFFLRSLTTMQMFFSPKVEWIFVCDDPELRTSMSEYLLQRKRFLRNRTVVVLNKANYGYGAANTIGTKVARGDFFLFMNSDIWMDDPEALEVAVAAIDGENFGVVGFRLLYEDGTVQHDGMTFERAPHVRDLYVIEHPGKGLPPRPAKGGIVDVPAVTGALLLTSRKIYEEVRGFTDVYIKGDFEDGDLCLKVAKAGYKIGIVQHPPSYHLERQSIKLMGDAGLRSTVTYLNCISFNELWGEEITLKNERPALQ